MTYQTRVRTMDQGSEQHMSGLAVLNMRLLGERYMISLLCGFAPTDVHFSHTFYIRSDYHMSLTFQPRVSNPGRTINIPLAYTPSTLRYNTRPQTLHTNN